MAPLLRRICDRSSIGMQSSRLEMKRAAIEMCGSWTGCETLMFLLKIVVAASAKSSSEALIAMRALEFREMLADRGIFYWLDLDM